jgi:hypothetical protein
MWMAPHIWQTSAGNWAIAMTVPSFLEWTVATALWTLGVQKSIRDIKAWRAERRSR